MRGHYLSPSDYLDRGGCRGGIGGGDGHEGYELEIGTQCYCSAEMMAFAIHYDEIMEYLALQKPESAIAAMIYRSILKATQDIKAEVAEKERVRREKDENLPTPVEAT